ncbi:prefoldin subunit alpha [Candidatus Micrarchaeota archaeon]|nr:prefoldin subunit alpha [Candidatus Micrarchaeota archaeon]
MADEKKQQATAVNLEEDITKLRFVESQLGALQREMMTLEDMIAALASARSAMVDLKKVDKDTPAMLPMGVGILAHGMVKKQNSVLVDVGAGVVVEKTIDETIEMIRKRGEEVQKQMDSIRNTFISLQNEYNKIGQKLEKELPIR